MLKATFFPTFLLLLTLPSILSVVEPDQLTLFYVNTFIHAGKDSRLRLNVKNGTNPNGDIPSITLTETILQNETTSVLNLTSSDMLCSCLEYPYKSVLSMYIENFFRSERPVDMESRYFYGAIYGLMYQILYYKYGSIDDAKEYITTKTNKTEKIFYDIPDNLKKYLSFIGLRTAYKNNFYFPEKQNAKDFINKFNIKNKNYDITNELYDFVLKMLPEKTPDDLTRSGILKFANKNHKEEFLLLYYYLNQNLLPLNFKQFQELYGLPKPTDSFLYQGSCVYISPITDMLTIELNSQSQIYNFDNKIVIPSKEELEKNSSLVPILELMSRNTIDKGVLKKYMLMVNDDSFFDYGPKQSLNTDFFIKSIEMSIDAEFIEKGFDRNPYNKACYGSKLCYSLAYHSKDKTYVGSFVLGFDMLNPYLLSFGRLVHLRQSDFEHMDLIKKALQNGQIINNYNNRLAYIWYNRWLNKAMKDYMGIYNVKKEDFEVENKEEIEDIYKFAYTQFMVIIDNKLKILSTLETELNKDIKYYKKLYFM